MSHGGGQYVDVIGYHFYDAPHPPEDMVPLIQKVEQLMAENGAGNKPLWNTETGWPYPKPFPSDDLAAAYLARAYILNWARASGGSIGTRGTTTGGYRSRPLKRTARL